MPALCKQIIDAKGLTHRFVASIKGATKQEVKMCIDSEDYDYADGIYAKLRMEETGQVKQPNECLLSDMHRDLHRGEKCPECGEPS